MTLSSNRTNFFSIFSSPLKKIILKTTSKLRYGKNLREAKRMDFLPPKEVKRLQERKLRELIRHCYEHVPYYQKLFKRLNLTPKDIQTIEDLKKLPILTKEEVIRHHREFLADNIPRSELKKVTTSGTTGTPFRLYTTQIEMERGWHIPRRLGLNSIGRDVNEKKIRIKYLGRKILWNEKNPHQEILLNSFFLNSDKLREIISKLELLNPSIITGRSTWLELIATHCKNAKQPLKGASAISLGEELFSHQRKIIEKALGCKVYNMYAQEEMSIHASDCRLRCGMHIAPWHSIVETDPKGKMISTSLFKRAYPFLRFDTQDYSKITTKKCSCGRTSPRIIHIIGREGGMLISREGATFGTSTIYKMLSSREFRIKNMNFVQNNKGEVLIFIDTRDPEKKEIERMVKNRLKHLFSINVHFKKRYTNATKKNLSIRSSLRA